MDTFFDNLSDSEIKALEGIIGESLDSLPESELEVLAESLYRRKRNASVRADAADLRAKGVEVKRVCHILHRVYYLSPTYIQYLIYLK